MVVVANVWREEHVWVEVKEDTVGPWKNRMALVSALRRFGHYPLTLLPSPGFFFLLFTNRWSKIGFVLKQSRGNGSKLGSIVSSGSGRGSINKMRAKVSYGKSRSKASQTSEITTIGHGG